jgi:hypothetical protein
MSDTTAYLANVAILILAAACVPLLIQYVRARRDLAQADADYDRVTAELDKTERSFATAADHAVRYQQLYHLARAEARELRAEVARCQETHMPELDAVTEATRPPTSKVNGVGIWPANPPYHHRSN